MNINDLASYFEKYVISYRPYKDIPEYKLLIDMLLKYYMDHSYNKINAPFKSAFEDQIIPTEFYNNLLLSVGYTKEIIGKFTLTDKEILLRSFMDYNRYKGTIEQVRLIGTKFKEPIGVYELFIDFKQIKISYYNYYFYNSFDVIYINIEDKIAYDTILINDLFTIDGNEYVVINKYKNDDLNKYVLDLDKPYIGQDIILTDFSIKRWVFLPNPIYTANDIKIRTEPFNYNEIYPRTDRYFVSIENLMSEYNNQNIILPIKSNLIFVDYNKYFEINNINNLFSAIFLKYYYLERIIINFKDGEYLTSLGKIYKLWNYIVMKYYKYNFTDSSINRSILFDINNINFDYDISDIEIIQNAYNEIETTNDYSKFYHEYISSKLENSLSIDKYIPLDQLELIIRNDIGDELINYITNRIESSILDFKEYEYSFILNEIYNSLITWSMLSGDLNIKNNVQYFLNNLSHINFPIDISPSYNLLLFFKPYHVEIISEVSDILQAKGKATSAITDEKLMLYVSLLKVSNFEFSEQLLKFIDYNIMDNAVVATSELFDINIIKNMIYDIQNINLFFIKYHMYSNIDINSIKTINNILLTLKSIVDVIIRIDFKLNLKSNINLSKLIINNINISINYFNESINEINSKHVDIDIKKTYKDNLFLINNINKELTLHIIDDIEIIDSLNLIFNNFNNSIDYLFTDTHSYNLNVNYLNIINETRLPIDHVYSLN